MPGQPIFWDTYVTVATPADSTEIVVAILPGVTNEFSGQAVKLAAQVFVSPDADATGCTVRMKRDDIAGADVGDSIVIGPLAATATSFTATLENIDTPGDIAGQVYVLTVEMTGASGPVDALTAKLHARID